MGEKMPSLELDGAKDSDKIQNAWVLEFSILSDVFVLIKIHAEKGLQKFE